MIHEKMVVVPSFSCSKKIHLAEERLFRFLCRIMVLKDRDRKEVLS